MSQGTSLIARRVVLKLDANMVFEALILNRLSRLPKARHQEWLRGLLVQGFKRECHSLRTLQRGLDMSYDVPPSVKDSVAQRSAASNASARVPERTIAPTVESGGRESCLSGGSVSFAALRNVIG
jgi:hypothetical protein